MQILFTIIVFRMGLDKTVVLRYGITTKSVHTNCQGVVGGWRMGV